MEGWKTISFKEKTYWKLLELKAKYKCDTWDEFGNFIYEVLKED